MCFYRDMQHSNNDQAARKLSVTVSNAALATGFSENYLRLLISKRMLPHVRVGRAVRLLVSDLEQFLLQHRHAARQAASTDGPEQR